MLEILDYQETPLGLLCLRRRELLSRPGTIVTEVTLNHVFLMSSYHTESERALASRALAHHAGTDSLTVMVGGLGLGFTAQEALTDPRVSEVCVIEFLPAVINWLAEGWIPDAEALKNDPRFSCTQADVYAQLLGPATKTYDLILIDVDHAPDEPINEASAPFYTQEGLKAVQQHLKPGGILGVWSTFPNAEFEATLAQVFPQVTSEVVSWHNDLIEEAKEDTLFYATLS